MFSLTELLWIRLQDTWLYSTLLPHPDWEPWSQIFDRVALVESAAFLSSAYWWSQYHALTLWPFWLCFMRWHTWMSGVKNNCSWLYLAGFMENSSCLTHCFTNSAVPHRPLLWPTHYSRMDLSIPGWHLHKDIFPTWASVWHCCSSAPSDLSMDSLFSLHHHWAKQYNTYPIRQKPSCKPWQPLHPLMLSQQSLIDCAELILTSIKSGSKKGLHSSWSRIA